MLPVEIYVMNDLRKDILNAETIVIKIGTSSLTFPNGRLNFDRIEQLVIVLSNLKDLGKKIVLVTSGSIAVGTSKIGRSTRPADLPGKQAAAAIGQAELMKIYQKFFSKYNKTVAQILLTYDVIIEAEKKKNAENTFRRLLEIDALPIVNENDSVATEEIEIGDNDTLSAMVAGLCRADLLILLSDIDGLFTADPKKNADAKRISVVDKLTNDIWESATGAGSSFGTGGMVTKLKAAELCYNNNINIIIANGDKPEILYQILNGEDIGTLFNVKK